MRGGLVTVEEISTIAWVVWAALILIFLVIEIFTLDFTFLMLGVASIGGVVAAALGVPWFFQLLIVGVLLTVALLGAMVIAAVDKPEDAP